MKSKYLALFSFLLIAQANPLLAQCPAGQELNTFLLEADISGTSSWDLAGDPDNQTLTVCNPDLANTLIHSLGWENITVNTAGASLCSEIGIRFNGIYDLIPGHLDVMGGPCGPYFTIHLIDISAENIIADVNGCITFEIFETLDNNVNAIDGTIDTGTLFLRGDRCIDIVPTLGQWGFILLSLVLLIFGVLSLSKKHNKLQFK